VKTESTKSSKKRDCKSRFSAVRQEDNTIILKSVISAHNHPAYSEEQQGELRQYMSMEGDLEEYALDLYWKGYRVR